MQSYFFWLQVKFTNGSVVQKSVVVAANHTTVVELVKKTDDAFMVEGQMVVQEGEIAKGDELLRNFVDCHFGVYLQGGCLSLNYL